MGNRCQLSLPISVQMETLLLFSAAFPEKIVFSRTDLCPFCAAPSAAPAGCQNLPERYATMLGVVYTYTPRLAAGLAAGYVWKMQQVKTSTAAALD